MTDILKWRDIVQARLAAEHAPVREVDEQRLTAHARTRERVSIHSGYLRDLAQVRWRNRCPCCDTLMTTRPPRGHQPTPQTYRTVGHDVAISAGGDKDRWIYICSRCNGAQGSYSFAGWEYLLRRAGNTVQAARVALVAKFFEENT